MAAFCKFLPAELIRDGLGKLCGLMTQYYQGLQLHGLQLDPLALK